MAERKGNCGDLNFSLFKTKPSKKSKANPDSNESGSIAGLRDDVGEGGPSSGWLIWGGDEMYEKI